MRLDRWAITVLTIGAQSGICPERRYQGRSSAAFPHSRSSLSLFVRRYREVFRKTEARWPILVVASPGIHRRRSGLPFEVPGEAGAFEFRMAGCF